MVPSMSASALVAVVSLAMVQGSPPASTRPQSARPDSAAARGRSVEGVAPPLRAEPKVVDFGFLMPNTPGVGTVMLTNTSEAPITIETVSASCKCTTINKIDGVVIAPGAVQSLEVKLDGAPAMGMRRSSVKIIVSGFGRPLDIPVRAEVSLPVRIVPPYVNAVGGKNLTGRVIVESIDRSPFRVLSTVGGSLRAEGDTDAAAPARASYIYGYDLVASADALPQFLYFETDSPKAPLVEVRVRSEKIDRSQAIDLLDTRALAGRVAPGGSAELAFTTRTARQRVDRVELDAGAPAGSRVELVGVDATADGGQSIRVKVAFPADAQGIVRVPLSISAGAVTQSAEVIASVR